MFIKSLINTLWNDRSAQWKAIAQTVLLAIVVPMLLSYMMNDAFAAAPPPADAKCTDDPKFNLNAAGANAGLISIIVQQVQQILNAIAQQMYQGIIGDGTFIKLVKGLATLYIAIYGILFTLGMVQATVSDVIIRCSKLLIVSTLISPGSWAFFGSTVIKFFNTGTDDMINALTAIAVGGVATNGPPFAALDGVITKAMSGKMIVTVLAVFAHGPNGMIIGLLLVAAIGAFMRSIFKAMWVYLMSLIMKTLMYGIAPIFISCILFTRTKHIFDGWLNQIINASLQPIMLFAFFAFFAKLIESSIDSVTSAPICWTEMADAFRGTRADKAFWRFKQADGSGVMVPFPGIVNFTGMVRADNNPQGPIFPIDILVVITFLMLAELATRFNDIVIEVAKDLSGAMTNLSAMGGSMNDWFSKVTGADAGGDGGKGGGGGPGKDADDKIGDLLGKAGGGARSFVEQMSTALGARPGGPGK